MDAFIHVAQIPLRRYLGASFPQHPAAPLIPLQFQARSGRSRPHPILRRHFPVSPLVLGLLQLELAVRPLAVLFAAAYLHVAAVLFVQPPRSGRDVAQLRVRLARRMHPPHVLVPTQPQPRAARRFRHLPPPGAKHLGHQLLQQRLRQPQPLPPAPLHPPRQPPHVPQHQPIRLVRRQLPQHRRRQVGFAQRTAVNQLRDPHHRRRAVPLLGGMDQQRPPVLEPPPPHLDRLDAAHYQPRIRLVDGQRSHCRPATRRRRRRSAW